MIKYDAWVEPWIPIEKKDGNYQQVSIFQALKDAHNIAAIRATTPTETFGISRLLITILTDIFRPKRWDDIDNIREQGSFAENQLQEYYNTCLTEGASFDLFDTKRPFLQYAFSKDEKPTIKPAASLFDALPVGNNVPHFVHNAEDAYAFTLDRCLQALCSIPFFEKHKRGGSTTTGINGVPPIYFLYNGNSLFETLVVSMTPHKEFGLPIWREENCFEKQRIGTVAPLHGLFASPLKVQLKSFSDNLIREILLDGQNVDYKDSLWTDPHVAYYIRDKSNELVSLKSRAARAVWRDLPIIIDTHALSFLHEWQERKIEKDLIAFVKLNELKGPLYMAVTQFTEQVKIPQALLDEDAKRQCFARAITLTDNISRECGNALKKTLRQLKGEGSAKETNPFGDILPSLFSETFLPMVKELIESKLYNQLIVADLNTHDWEANINNFLTENLRIIVFATLNTVLGNISDENTDILILKNQLRNNAVKRLNILLKKGGYSSDKNRISNR